MVDGIQLLFLVIYNKILLLLLFIDHTQNGTQWINIYNTHRI